MILRAQRNLPFQVLIPAYLPAGFNRKAVEIRTDLLGPQGEPLAQLVYPTWHGERLTISEWVPQTVPEGEAVGGAQNCICQCQTDGQCSANHFMIDAGPLRVMAEMSGARLLTRQQMLAILETLGPAANLQVTTRLEDVADTFGLPPAVEIPTGADGVQEVVLVITSEGYTPAHFSVYKDIPARLVFRQLGQVGCGNELVFRWGDNQQTLLTLAGTSDTQILEFTPGEAGEFPFNCPHEIYRGAMTVLE